MNFDAMGNYYGQVNNVLEQPDTEANVKPVTQTITTDPKTGEQMMTVKGRPEDLSAANPNTPTVTPPTQPTFRFGAPQGQPQQYMNLADSASQQPVAYQPVAPQPAPVQTAPQPAPAVAPMAPDQTYNRMIQAESGGRQFAPDGQVLTSPRGAMGVGQVMPSTAMQPGYGVPSIFDMAEKRGMPVTSRDQATAQQLLSNEQLNRDFGQTYYNAMQQRFPGQPAAAVAAYNAGPGRVGQNMQANAGQLNVSQLPQETQGYLQKVQPTAPTPPMIAGAPSTDIGLTPTEQAIRQQAIMTPDQRYANDFITNQNNPEALAKLRFDKNAPEWVRTLASQKELTDLRNRDETAKVEQRVKTAIENNDGRALANMLNPRGKERDEGSIAKAFLYSLIGFQSGAAAEVEKMGLKDKWEAGQLGEYQVAVKSNPRGEAKEAVYTSGPLAGQRVSEDQLALLYGAGAGGKVTTSGTFFQTPDGTIVRSQSDEKGRTKLVDAATGQRYTGASKGLVKLEEAGALRKMDYGLITDLKKQFGTDAIKALTKYQELVGPLDETSRSKFLEMYGFGQAQPTTIPSAPPPSGVVTPTPAPTAPAPNAVMPGVQNDRGLIRQPGAPTPIAPTPVQAPAAPTTAPVAGAPSLTTPIATLETNRQAQLAGQKEIAKTTGEVVALSQDTRNLIKSIEKTETLLDSGAHNVGSVLSVVGGRGPIAQAVGGQFETKDAKNTKLILDTVNKLATEGLKVLGANPSSADLKFWTENKPNGSTDPEVMKEWIASRKDDLVRRLEYANKQTQSGGTAGVAPPVPADETPADKARRELERRRKGGGST